MNTAECGKLLKSLTTRYDWLKKTAQKNGLKKIAKEEVKRACPDKKLNRDLQKAIDFGMKKFRNTYRQDKKTPLFLHSLFLLEIVSIFGEAGPETLLTAVLHDALEDTPSTEKEISALRFESTPINILPLVKKLTQNKRISDKLTPGSVISSRVRDFIQRLTGAPREVIHVELADRIHDLLDIDYLKTLEPKAAEIRLKNKIERDVIMVSEIIKKRRDINHTLVAFFNFLATWRKSKNAGR